MFLRFEQKTGPDFVARASAEAKFIRSRLMRGPCDAGPALRRAESQFGLSASALWGLIYRPPKSVSVELWFRIEAVGQFLRAQGAQAGCHGAFMDEAVGAARARAAEAASMAGAAGLDWQEAAE